MSSDQLGLAQNGVRIIRFLSLWLFILVLVMFGLAIYLATGRRRETLRNVGFAFVLVGLLVLVVREVIGNYVIGGLTDTPRSTGPGITSGSSARRFSTTSAGRRFCTARLPSSERCLQARARTR